MYTCVPTFSLLDLFFPLSLIASAAGRGGLEERSKEWWKENSEVLIGGGVFTRVESFGKSLISFSTALSLSLLCSALSVSRAVKRTVNGQARKRARGSPRRHLTLPLGEEVLLPLFKASLPSSLSPPSYAGLEIYRVFRSADASAD